MGSGKRSQRAPVQLRSRTTRSSKARLLSDPEQSSQLLTAQLRALGLYAAATVGDGNCLFRALSDQLYGSPSKYAQVRRDICDWIAAHGPRYEPFVEDERGLDVHLKCMRENGTYGGHMELSAFAHLMRYNVKVIQPGLVYVIEWNAGGDFTSQNDTSTDSPKSERDMRHLMRDKKRADSQNDNDDPQGGEEGGTIYVAYHDYEHFSSIRNLRGPHTGLPKVKETPPPPEPEVPTREKPLKERERREKERKSRLREEKIRMQGEHKDKAIDVIKGQDAEMSPTIRLRLSAAKPTSKTSSFSSLSSISSSSTQHLDPISVPLPDSRATSPTPSHPPSSSASVASRISSIKPTSLTKGVSAPHLQVHRSTRSPKRSYDESGASAGEEEQEREGGKRTRRRGGNVVDKVLPPSAPMEVEDIDGDDSSRDEDAEEEDDDDDKTPELSLPSSSSSPLSVLSSASSSSASTPSPPPEEKQDVYEKPLTRRQRKTLGLPKPRVVGVSPRKAPKRGGQHGDPKVGAGKIVIPGGRWKGWTGARDGTGEEGDKEEWRRNGTGRVDVRGFRELKI